MSTTPVTTTALAPKPDKLVKFESLQKLIATRKSDFEALAGKALDPQRVFKMFLDHAWRTPDVLHSTPDSIVRALMYCAQLKLEPCGAWGVWLTPFRNSYNVGTRDEPRWEQRLEIVPIVDYRGLATLMRRNANVRALSMHEVYEKDTYSVRFGDDEHIEHVPANAAEEDRGKIIAAYAVATLDGGWKQRCWMWRADIDRIRAKSKAGAGKSSPWTTDYGPMAMKTAIKQLAKLLPVTDEFREALDTIDAIETAADDATVIDNATGEIVEPRRSRADALKRDLWARREPAPPPIDVPAGEPEEPFERDEPEPREDDAAPAEGDADPKWTSADTEALRGQLDALYASLVDLAGESKAKAAWNGNRGPGSLRGVRSQAHADRRLDAARALVEAAKRAE